MWTWELVLQTVLIGASLAMDAFAVSVCNGMCYRDMDKKKGGITAATFGLFQMAMPLTGFFIAFGLSRFIDTGYIDMFDHWIAFALLMFIGVKMIFDAAGELRGGSEAIMPKKFSMAEVLVQGVATSIDALAVGVSFIAMYDSGINEVTVWGYTAIIGVVTFAIAAAGVFLGSKAGKLFEKKAGVAQIIGGLVLVCIGVKILIEGII